VDSWQVAILQEASLLATRTQMASFQVASFQMDKLQVFCIPAASLPGLQAASLLK